nr:hypothetical protein [Tanacetum cinerariifolium]
MADQPTLAELLRAPTDGYAEEIMVPSILAEQFELKHSLINMMTSDQIRDIGVKRIPLIHNKVSLRMRLGFLDKRRIRDIGVKRIPLIHNKVSLRMRLGFLDKRRTTNLRNEISNFQQRFDESFHEAWDIYKDLLRACPRHGFTELHQLDSFYNALNPSDQDSLNSAAGGSLLERRNQDVLTIIENKSKIAKLTHAVNQQTSVVTTAMTAILKQFQATPPPASVKAIKEICVTYGGAHPYYQCLAANVNTFPERRDNIQGYVAAAAVKYNQGNSGDRPPGVANQIRPSGFAQPNVQNNQNRTTNLRNEISNFQQRFDESFHEAWDIYKDLLRACPRHGFTELHQLDSFYNALNPSDQDSLNSAAGGSLLERRNQDVLTIIENKSKVRNS